MYDSSTHDGRNKWKRYNGISAQRGTVKKVLAGVGGGGVLDKIRIQIFSQ